MKLYISGNTNQPPDQTREEYSKAAREITKMGHEPMNPFDLPAGNTLLPPWHERLELLTYQCDGIYLLSSWQESEQASTERYNCLVTGKQIFYQSAEKEQSALDDRKSAAIERIKEAIHEATGMTIDQYRVHSRKEDYVFARMIFSHYGKRADLSPEEISICLNRNKSMVYHYFKRYADEVRYTPKFRCLAQKVDKFLQKSELQ
jgi:hypothetical protein